MCVRVIHKRGTLIYVENKWIDLSLEHLVLFRTLNVLELKPSRHHRAEDLCRAARLVYKIFLHFTSNGRKVTDDTFAIYKLSVVALLDGPMPPGESAGIERVFIWNWTITLFFLFGATDSYLIGEEVLGSHVKSWIFLKLWKMMHIFCYSFNFDTVCHSHAAAS